MRDGFWIFDVDRHVHEPLDLWADYLPKSLADYVPQLVYLDHGEPLSERMTVTGPDGPLYLPPDLVVDGKPVMNISKSAKIAIAAAAVERPQDLAKGSDAQGHLTAMDKDGIDAALLLPSYAGYLIAMPHKEPRIATAFAEAYNRWIADLCAADPNRLHGAAIIARYDPDAMIDQARFALDKGWSTVVVRPNPIAGRLLGDPADAPFWTFCAENGLRVVVHEAAHAQTDTVGADRFQSRFSQHACSHPMEQMMAFLSLLESGTFERNPDLRVAFLEAGAGWMVHWLWRLDELEYAHLADEVADTIKMPPSDYFRRQCAIGFEPDEPLINETISYLGEDKLMFGSDFPHLDHGEDIISEALTLDLPQNRLRAVIGDNARHFFGIESMVREDG